MRIKSIMLVIGVLAAGLVVAGCGGGDDSTSSSTGASGASGATGVSGSLSKEEWIAKADAICKAGDAKIEQEGQQTFGGGGKPSQAEQEQFATDTLVPNVQSELDQINALPPPQGAEDEASQILDDAQSSLDQIKSDPSTIDTAFDKTNQEARDFGLKVCGQD